MHSAEIVLVIVTTSYTWCGAQAGLAGFGGDYGEYLNLLKGNDVLDDFGGGGMDDIEAGQARQEAVMGGEEEELKDGFLRHSKYEMKKKEDIHFHFDVNVLLVTKNVTPVDKANNKMFNPIIEKELKFMERESNGAALPDASKSEPFDWKKFQVRYFKLYKFNLSNLKLCRRNLQETLAERLLVVGEERLEEDKLEDKLALPLEECLAVEVLQDHQLEDKLVTWAKETTKKPKKLEGWVETG